jgi:hypothetical protein
MLCCNTERQAAKGHAVCCDTDSHFISNLPYPLEGQRRHLALAQCFGNQSESLRSSKTPQQFARGSAAVRRKTAGLSQFFCSMAPKRSSSNACQQWAS